jgi:hypothetical protein
VRIFVDQFNDQIRTEARIGFALRRRQFNTSQSILAMPELRGDQLLIERMLSSARDRQVAPPG